MSREATLRSWSERDIAVLDAAVKMSDGGARESYMLVGPVT